jgi:transaldolase
MSILLDSAIVTEALQARELGWVKGITTNPTLLAQSPETPEKTLRSLAVLGMGPLFYQLTSTSLDEMRLETEAARKLVGDSLVLKIAPTSLGFQFVSEVSADIPCCITAVYSVAQAAVAREAGARYVAVYVNRATRMFGDGMDLVSGIGQVLVGSSTEIVAASIKTQVEASGTLRAGAHHLTIPLEVLKGLTEHELSAAAVAQFDATGVGIQW